mmetsp:Transcript_100752/g.324940  ORF Transcript_100752/g.324940 Transcript_100752/m.324940 type:complete len:401 (+) Transcript_100752:225-1427(+)
MPGTSENLDAVCAPLARPRLDGCCRESFRRGRHGASPVLPPDVRDQVHLRHVRHVPLLLPSGHPAPHEGKGLIRRHSFPACNVSVSPHVIFSKRLPCIGRELEEVSAVGQHGDCTLHRLGVVARVGVAVEPAAVALRPTLHKASQHFGAPSVDACHPRAQALGPPLLRRPWVPSQRGPLPLRGARGQPAAGQREGSFVTLGAPKDLVASLRWHRRRRRGQRCAVWRLLKHGTTNIHEGQQLLQDHHDREPVKKGVMVCEQELWPTEREPPATPRPVGGLADLGVHNLVGAGNGSVDTDLDVASLVVHNLEVSTGIVAKHRAQGGMPPLHLQGCLTKRLQLSGRIQCHFGDLRLESTTLRGNGQPTLYLAELATHVRVSRRHDENRTPLSLDPCLEPPPAS